MCELKYEDSESSKKKKVCTRKKVENIIDSKVVSYSKLSGLLLFPVEVRFYLVYFQSV